MNTIQMYRRWPSWQAALLAAAVLTVASCSTGHQPCYPVHGEVFVGEGEARKPAAGAHVLLHPVNAAPDDPARPRAYVGEGGRFELTTYANGDGAPAGDYTITIEWRPSRPPPPLPPTKMPDRLDGQFSDPKAARILFSVERKKDNVVPTIDLH